MTDYSEADARDSYNDILYPGGTHANTHPDNLYLIGKLFGLNPTPMDKMRVLEIGCAIGNNLFPMAIKFPQGQFFGIDISDKQIAEARRIATNGGVENIHFISGSIADYATLMGKFDYIICHGVFSWVPDHVQKAILLNLQHSLTDDGLAILSYNTRPGWNFLLTIRDIMMYEGRKYSKDKKLQLEKSKKFFEEISQLAGENENILVKELRNRYDTWMNAPDYYLSHELLEGINEPLYFHEFNSMCENNGLAFVAESNAIAHILDNMAPNVKKIFEESRKRIDAEQMADFVLNRQFRSSVVCRKERKLSKVWNVELLESMNFYLHFDVSRTENGNWKLRANEVSIGNENELPNKVLEIMAGHRLPMMLNEWVQFIHNKNNELAQDKILTFFKSNILQLFARGFLTMTPVKFPISVQVDEKPKINGWARGAVSSQINGNICTIFHNNSKVDDTDKIIIPLMNGEHTIGDIADHLMGLMKAGRITVNAEAKSDDEIMQNFKNLVSAKYNHYLKIGAMI